MANKRQDHKETQLARMLTYALAVNPAEFGILPDLDEGWYPIKDLVKALTQEDGWRHIRGTMIQDIAQRVAPDEFEISENKIRCLSRKPPRPVYGETPNAHLYLGLRRKAWPNVSKKGLSPKQDNRIILAATKEEALKLGKRQDSEPVLITVQAHQAMDQGVIFALWGESLYLCDWLPCKCLMGPRVEEKPQPKKPAKPKPEKSLMPELDSMPGSFIVDMEDMEKPCKRKGLKKDIAWKKERRRDNRRKN